MPEHSDPTVHDVTDIYEMLRVVLSEKFDLEPARITPEATLDDLGLDYLAGVELLTDLQDIQREPAGRTLAVPPGVTLAHLVELLNPDTPREP